MKLILEAIGAPFIWIGTAIVFIGVMIAGPDYGHKIADKISPKD